MRLVIATPCFVLTLLSAWWTVGLATGRGLWPADEVTLAEAVATRNSAEALRLIQRGADVNRPGRVRDGLLTNGYDVDILPVEAAVAAQRADALRMLIANGATVDERELRVLRCLEQSRHDGGVRDILDARASGSADCSGVQLPTDRTTQP
jgi:hypothetical protein